MADPFDPTPARGFQPFILTARYTDVVCEEPGYEGFSVNVRMNLSNGELTALNLALKDQQARLKTEIEQRQFEMSEISRLSTEARDAGDAEKTARLTARMDEITAESSAMVESAGRFTQELIAPYVRRWNVYTSGPDGEPAAVPAPQIAGVDAFAAIDAAMTTWLVTTVLTAYRGGKGFRPLPTTAAAKQGRGDEPTSGDGKGTPTPSSRRSPRNSRSPEA